MLAAVSQLPFIVPGDKEPLMYGSGLVPYPPDVSKHPRRVWSPYNLGDTGCYSIQEQSLLMFLLLS